MEKVTSKYGKGLNLEYRNISCPTDLSTIYALKFTTVRGFLSCFSSKGHWASLEFTTPIAFEFVSSISSGQFPRTTTAKASYEDRTLGLQFKLIFAQLLEHSRGVARMFPWGGPKYRFHNFCICNATKWLTSEFGGIWWVYCHFKQCFYAKNNKPVGLY